TRRTASSPADSTKARSSRRWWRCAMAERSTQRAFPRLKKTIVIPVAAVLLFLFGGWTLRNKLAADRQGEWVRATRGDLVTGLDVTGTLSAVESDLIGPPQLNNVWE